MIRNIIWDLDGTLFDTYPAISRAFEAALKSLGAQTSLDRIARLARISIGHCARSLAEEFQLNEDELGTAFVAQYDAVPPEAQPPFPGVKGVCARIHTTGGKNVIVTHRRETGTIRLLAAHHLAEYFAGYITAENGYPRKPDPAAFTAVMELHHLKPAETMTVGDRDIDILAGRAAGIMTCFFGARTAEIDADLTVSSFDELLGTILSENGPIR